MKISSIGSLAGLAVLIAAVAPAAEAAVVLSSTVVNTPGPTSTTGFVSLDIDGDTSEDLGVFGESTAVGLISSTGVAVEPGGFIKVLSPGDTVGPALTFDNPGMIYDSSDPTHSPSALGIFYAGITFTGTDSQLHYGWVKFDFPSGGAYPLNSTVVSAAWETSPNTPIVVAAVPEPGIAVVAAGLGMGFWAIRRRFFRSS